MREILFRGRKTDDEKWVYGFYVHLYCISKDMETHRIYDHFAATDCGDFYPDWYEVEPATVGQYTGLQDKNGEKIFEGDIVEGPDFDAEDGYGVVGWDDGAFEIENGMWCGTFHENYDGKELEVIGNIHDNPELLEEKHED